jgi:hypothetical protein
MAMDISMAMINQHKKSKLITVLEIAAATVTVHNQYHSYSHSSSSEMQKLSTDSILKDVVTTGEIEIQDPECPSLRLIYSKIEILSEVDPLQHFIV